MRILRMVSFGVALSVVMSGCATSATAQLFFDTKPGKSLVLDVSELIPKLDLLRFDEREEQIADWAVYGTLLSEKPSVATLRAATYDKVPLRLPGLEEAFHFDYGPGRRVVLLNGNAWLFESEYDEHPRATLARLADQVRMELGRVPDRFAVFSYRSDLRTGRIWITRKPDLTGKTLFSPQYGYHEAVVTNVKQLQGWLHDIDDVTHVRQRPDGIELGGRRLDDSRTPNLDLEDIAALYKAQGDSKEPGFSLDPTWSATALKDDLQLLVYAPAKLVDNAALVLASSISKPMDDSALPIRATSALQLVSAFSGADPTEFKAGGWANALEQAYLLAAYGDDSAGTIVNMGIAKLFEMGTARSAFDNQMYGFLRFIAASDQNQCARYEGALEGTRVGMNLYYTDLLAKLWTSDYHRASPVNEVFGLRFDKDVADELGPLLWNAEASTVRLWFGPRVSGYSVDKSNLEIGFAHIATQVFGKGSRLGSERDEKTAPEDKRRGLMWWDRHYERVADYEGQYHIQNQIMKWSIIAGWLAKNKSLPELSTVSVYNKNRFDKWYSDNKDVLRFHYDIGFRPVETWPDARHECIELLASYPYRRGGRDGMRWQGGVSLGSLESVEHGPKVSSSVFTDLRRGGLNADKSTTEHIETLQGPSYDVPSNDVSTVKTTPFRDAPLRFGGAELRNETMTAQLTSASVSVRSNAGQILNFQSADVNGTTRLTATSPFAETREMLKEGGKVVETTSARRSEVSAKLASEPRFLPRLGVYVLERDDGEASLIAKAGHELRRVDLAATRPADAAGLTDAAIDARGQRVYLSANPLTAAEAAEQLGGFKWQRIGRCPYGCGEGRAGEVTRVFTNRGPFSGRPIEIVTKTGRIDAVVEREHVWIRRRAGERSFEDVVMSEGFTDQFVAELTTRAREATLGERVSVVAPGVAAHEPGEDFALVDELRAAALAGKLDETFKRLAPRVDGDVDMLRLGHPAIAEYRDIKRGAMFGMSPRVAASITLEHEGSAFQTVAPAHLQARAPSSLVEQAVRLIEDGQGGSIFVRDDNLLHQLDWDGRPGPSAARVLKDPQNDVRLIPMAEYGHYRPSKLKVESQSKQKVEEHTYYQRRVLERPLHVGESTVPIDWLRTAAGPMALAVSRCQDLNHDGQLSTSEIVLCHCDDNDDGKLDANEQRACGSR